MIRHAFVIAAMLGASPAAAQALAQCHTADHLINRPGANWAAYGPYKGKWIKATGNDETPEAWQVSVDKGPNPYTTGAFSPIEKPIAAGDAVVVELWMRAPEVKPGETTPIPSFGAGETDAPYTPIASGSADIGPEWTLYRAAGKATKAFTAGQARATVHLAAAKHVIQLGAILIFDCGKDADPAQLLK